MTPSQSVFHTEHLARLSRLNMRAPEAGPLIVKAKPIALPVVAGKQLYRVPLPEKERRDWLYVSSKRFGDPTVEQIQDIVAIKFGMTRKQLLAKRRAREYARPRQIAIYLAMKLATTLSLAEIARRFDMDRKTVWHGRRKIESLCKYDDKIRATVAELEAVLSRELRGAA